jgi:hypothetical protein
VRSIVKGRYTDQIEVTGSVKLPENEEVGESLDVDKPGLEFGQDLEYAIGFMFRVQTLGNLTGLIVRAAHESNGLGNEHISSYLASHNSCGVDSLDAVDGS